MSINIPSGELEGLAAELKARHPIPEKSADTYRSGFDVGYGLAIKHFADYLEKLISRIAKDERAI